MCLKDEAAGEHETYLEEVRDLDKVRVEEALA